MSLSALKVHSVLFRFDIFLNIVRGQNLIILTYFDRLSTEPVILNVPIISVMSANFKTALALHPAQKQKTKKTLRHKALKLHV